MNITIEWLHSQDACQEGVEWFSAQTETDGPAVVRKLMADDRFSWANWLLVRLLNLEQQVQYAIFSADQVLGIWDRKYPDNGAPREAIAAAKACLESPTAENAKRALKAADAAAECADATYAASDAAAYAVYAAECAAAYATYATYAAECAAAYAADAAAWAATYAAECAADAAVIDAIEVRRTLKGKLIDFGLSLLEGKK